MFQLILRENVGENVDMSIADLMSTKDYLDPDSMGVSHCIAASEQNSRNTFLQSEMPLVQRSWGDVTDEFLDICKLENDWDGMGAANPNNLTLETCSSCLRQLRERRCPPPSFMRPSPDGAICLEWQHQGWRFEIEVSEKSIECIEMSPTGVIRLF
jgi:hypothetical protein